MTDSDPNGRGQPDRREADGMLVRLRRSGRGQTAAAVVGLTGAALVALSLLPAPGPDAGWVRDALLTLGSSALLFAPFYVLTRTIDQHLDRVSEETTEQVENVRADTARQVADVRSANEAVASALTGEVQALRVDVDRRLEEVAQRVSERLQTEAAADSDAFARLRVDSSREVVWEAMIRAKRLGLLSDRQTPRVRVSRLEHLYASVNVDDSEWADDEPLQVHLEELDGTVLDTIAWPLEMSDEDLLVLLGRALYAQTSEQFDPMAFLSGLADLLEAAASHPERRPAVQLCPPQWMVCDWGVASYDEVPIYTVAHRRLLTISDHVAGKRDTNADSWAAAVEAARSLYPELVSGRDVWGSAGGDPWAGPAQDDPAF